MRQKTAVVMLRRFGGWEIVEEDRIVRERERRGIEGKKRKKKKSFFFQAEDGIRVFCLSRGLGGVYKRQGPPVVRRTGALPSQHSLSRDGCECMQHASSGRRPGIVDIVHYCTP